MTLRVTHSSLGSQLVTHNALLNMLSYHSCVFPMNDVDILTCFCLSLFLYRLNANYNKLVL